MRKASIYAKLAMTYARYKLNSPTPALLIIVPTTRCNLKCSYCEYYRNGNKKNLASMSKKTMLDLVDSAAKLMIPYISFSGGEPLISPDIEEIAKYAHEKNIMLNLNTNGTLITEDRAQAMARYFDEIRVSLDGPREYQDKLCRVPGSYDMIVQGIKVLKKHGARVGINSVYTKESENQIDQLVNNIGNQVDFVAILPRFSFIHDKKSGFQQASNEFREKVKNWKKSGLTIHDSLLYTKPSKKCDYGRLYLTIYPTGGVAGCPFITDQPEAVLGNIYEENLIDIFNNSKNKKFKVHCNGCHATCTTQLSAMYRENLFRLLWRMKNAL